METKIDVKLSPPQYDIYNDNTRNRVVVAGRRGGKTFLSIMEILKFALKPHTRNLWYIAPSYGMAKRIIWEPLQERLRQTGLIKSINISELSIKLKDGTNISLMSADKPDSLRGVSLDFVVFDEVAEIKPETWNTVIRPTLSDRKGHAFFIGTPQGFGNWTKTELYDKGLDVDEKEWKSFRYTTEEGRQVDPVEIESARRDMDERSFRQEYCASFETYAGAIYYAFKREKHVFNRLIEVDPHEDVHIGIDFNVDPMSAVVGVFRMHKDRQKLCIIRNIEMYGSNTNELVNEINELYPLNPKHAYPDASGANRTTIGNTNHNILRQAGWNIHTGKGNPKVSDRIQAVNSAFETFNGNNRLLVYKDCKSLINSLEKQEYKPGTKQPDKNSGYDHLNDSIGYLIYRLMPVRKMRDSNGGMIENPLNKIYG